MMHMSKYSQMNYKILKNEYTEWFIHAKPAVWEKRIYCIMVA